MFITTLQFVDKYRAIMKNQKKDEAYCFSAERYFGFGVGPTKAPEVPGFGLNTGVTLTDARINYGIEAGKQPIPVLDSDGNIQGIGIKPQPQPSRWTTAEGLVLSRLTL